MAFYIESFIWTCIISFACSTKERKHYLEHRKTSSKVNLIINIKYRIDETLSRYLGQNMGKNKTIFS